jgi:hypothetical protein
MNAPLNFPANPTNGQQYRGFTFDGAMWVGGFQAQGVSNAEQFFDLAGKTSLDVQVPTWAQGVQIIGSVQTEGTGGPNIGFRYSFDGTTFAAGATDYMNGGPVLNAGSTGYQAFGQSAASLGWLTINGDNANLPNQFTAEINVKRSSTARAWPWKTFGRTHDSAATALHRTYIAGGFFNSASSSLEVKTLRILMSNGAAMGAGSWLRVRWIGDLNQQPNGVSIVDAPADGSEYVRVNNLWRKKSQSFILDGLTNFDFVVPPGARAVRVYASLMPPNPGVAANSILLRASLDGTTFLAGASDYHYSGFISYSGSAGFANLGSVVSANCYLAFNNDSNIVQEVIDLRMSLIRPTVPSNQPWYGMVNSISYQSAAANSYNAAQVRVGVMNTNAGAVTALKALRIVRASGAFGSPSYATTDWYY